MVVGEEPMAAGVFFFVHSLHKSDLLLHGVYYSFRKPDNRNE